MLDKGIEFMNKVHKYELEKLNVQGYDLVDYIWKQVRKELLSNCPKPILIHGLGTFYLACSKINNILKIREYENLKQIQQCRNCLNQHTRKPYLRKVK